MDSVYDLYRSGCELLDHGDHQAAIVPLTRARKLEPDKASIREALGRALFHAQRYEDAAAEFARSPRGHPPTTTRSSAWVARCSSWAATRRRASRWRSPAHCVPSAATTGSTGSARYAPVHGA